MKTGLLNLANAVKDSQIAILFRRLIEIVDGRLTFGDNIQGKIIRGFFFAQANFDYPLEHGLGRVVTDFLVLNKNQFADFKSGSVTPTTTRIYLQCDTAGTTADILILG